MKRTIPSLAAAATWLCAVLLAGSAFAQQTPEPQKEAKDYLLSFELFKPNFDTSFDHDNFAVETSTMFLSFGMRLNDNLRLKAELPAAYCGMKQGPGSGGTVGNPYVGLEGHATDSDVYLEIGARAPLAPTADSNLGRKSAALSGVFTDPVDREEAFISDTVPITASISYRPVLKSGVGFDLRTTPSFWLSTKKGIDDEFYILYSGRIFARALDDKLEVGSAFSGRWWTSKSGSMDFGDETTHQMILDASYALGQVRPGVTFRLPLDKDMKNVQQYVFGLNLGVNF